MKFYEIFTKLSAEKGLSPSAAALKLGLHKSNVTAWKKDGYTPRSTTLNKIAQFFGVTTDYLLDLDGHEDIGYIIREERQAQKLTLTELARTVGLSEKRLADYELDRRPISTQDFENIAKGLGFSYASLLNKYNLYDKDINPAFNGDADAQEDFDKAVERDALSENITFDDFTYAMYDESRDLTDEQKKMLLDMARMLRERQHREGKDKQ